MKLLALRIAISICIACGVYNVYAYAPPQAIDQVTVKKVKFKNRINITVVGNLYTPNNLDKNGKYPAIIVGHPFGG